MKNFIRFIFDFEPQITNHNMSQSEITPADDVAGNINCCIFENSIVLEFSDYQLMNLYLDDISTYRERVRRPNRVGHNFSLATFWEFIGYLKGRHIPEKEHVVHLKELLQYKNNAQYVVGYVEGDLITKRHELTHARFHTNIMYRSYVYELWDRMHENEKQRITEHFQNQYRCIDDIVNAFQASYFTYGPRFAGFYIEGAFL